MGIDAPVAPGAEPDGLPPRRDAEPVPAVPAPRTSRRGLLLSAGAAGVAAAAAAGTTGAEVWHHEAVRYRAMADAATVAEHSAASTLKVLWRADTTRRVMALTFDDGPGPTLTSPLLDVLAEHKVRASFSLVGEHAYARRELVVRQLKGGHELVNHSWSHPDLSALDLAAQTRELERTDQLLYELTGKRPAMIRPPYGRVNGELLAYAARNRQSILLWDMRFHESVYDVAGNAKYVLETMRPGSILLGHDNGSANRWVGTHAVPAIIQGAKARGYEFVTASEMLALDGVKTAGS